MARVTVTGKAWDGDRAPVPAVNEPELWFRPIATSMLNGLLSDREIPAKTFTVSTGTFSVDLESFPDLFYVPILRWLKNPGDPNNRSRGQTEWPAFNPGQGGDISSLVPLIGLTGLLFGFGPPPQQFETAVYLDITGPKIRIYGPAGGRV